MRPQSISEILSPERDALTAFNSSENERIRARYARIRRRFSIGFFVVIGALFLVILFLALSP